MQHTEALRRLRTLFTRDPGDTNVDVLSGPDLLDQEPDLRQETARYSVRHAAWAAAGHPND